MKQTESKFAKFLLGMRVVPENFQSTIDLKVGGVFAEKLFRRDVVRVPSHEIPVDHYWMSAKNIQDDLRIEIRPKILAKDGCLMFAQKVIQLGLVLDQPFSPGISSQYPGHFAGKSEPG